MKRQKISDVPKELEKENVSKFKGALNRAKSGIRNRMMPIVLSSMIAFSPAFGGQSANQDKGAGSFQTMSQIERGYPSIKSFDMLKQVLYLKFSEGNRSLSSETKKVIENVGTQIVKNQGNKIYSIMLNAVLKQVLEDRPEDKNYFISASEIQVIIKDDAKSPKRTLVVRPSGTDGIEVDVEYADTGDGQNRSFSINPTSPGSEVNNLRIRVSEFFDNLISGLIMIQAELDENKGKN
jgi:hypothetical protein